MNIKKLVQWFVIAMLLVAPFAPTGNALAWSNCSSQITVQWGDTLSQLAVTCNTTVEAIRAANPGLGWWLYAGQVLYIPGGYTTHPNNPPTYATYTVRWGDTLGKIAARSGTSVANLLAVNPQIYNPSLIYIGQVIYLPAGVSVPPPTNYPPPSNPPPANDGYSSLKIAYKYGMYVRSAPGGKIIASALDGTTWKYKPGSLVVDNKWKVWVEVKISPPAKGYSTGWLLVKDQFGTYFTDPQINP